MLEVILNMNGWQIATLVLVLSILFGAFIVRKLRKKH